ncbi:hypothetical protein TWF696_008619 [Orbilia brochopaga]|uniref:Uncharacterized protein n=1 Tax=Orbilia brochopaga TaxID=3140254 RepID=A0AAV9UIG6_9PEZI
MAGSRLPGPQADGLLAEIPISCNRPAGLPANLKTPTIIGIRSALSLTEDDYHKLCDTITTMLHDADFRNTSLDIHGSTEEERTRFCTAISDSLSSSLAYDPELISKLTVKNKSISPWLLYKLVLLRRKRFKQNVKYEPADISKDETLISVATPSIMSPSMPPPISYADLAFPDSKENVSPMFDERRSRSPSPSKRTFSKIDEAPPIVGKIVHNKSQKVADSEQVVEPAASGGGPALPPTKRIRREATEAAIASVTEPRPDGQKLRVKKQRSDRHALSENAGEITLASARKDNGMALIPAICVTILAVVLGICYVRIQ